MPLSEPLYRERLEQIGAIAELPGDVASLCGALVPPLADLVGPCAIAIKPQAILPWRVYGADGESTRAIAAQLSRVGVAGPISVANASLLILPLSLTPPHQGLLLHSGPISPELASVLPVLGMSLSNRLFGEQATEQERLMIQLGRRLRAVQQLSLQINNSYDLNAMAASVCSITTQAMGAQYAALYHVDGGLVKMVEDLAVLKPKGGGLLKMLQDANARCAKAVFPLSEAGFLAQVLETGKPLSANFAEKPGDCPPSLAEHQLAAAIAVPLVTQREILGILLVGSQSPRSFTASEQELLGDLAQQATGAFVTHKLFGETVVEKQRADRMVEQLRILNKASASIGANLSVSGACQELLAHIPNFMVSHWQALYLRKDDAWQFASGSTPVFDQPPAQWIEALEHERASLILTPELLAGTPFAEAGRVILFPLRSQEGLLGLVIVATETQTDTTGMDLVETLTGHAALTLTNANNMEQIERQAITDGLTGVYNRRYFNERLANEILRSTRFQHPLSLIIMDIDFFKAANDILGHMGGDTVLKELAALLKDKVRKVDIVARYGGEEFAIILPETSAENGLYVAEKIRGWVEEFPFTDEQRLPHKSITSSVGVATFPDHAKGMEDLVHLADEALYDAKKNGRNRVGRIPSKAN